MQAAKFNHPAISCQWAMQEYAVSREAERRALIERGNIEPGMTVVDVQAAGGFLSEGVYEYLNGQVNCICVEPVVAFHDRLDSRFQVIDDQIDNMRSIGSGSVDAVLGLAGLHHSPSKDGTIGEAFRVLKKGGTFAVCDVIQDSAVAGWLNEYVDRHSTDGHKGDFIVPGEVADRMRRAGFREVQEQVLNVPWVFESRYDIARFFKGLFNLHPTQADIDKAISDYFEVTNVDGQFIVDWHLIYANGTK